MKKSIRKISSWSKNYSPCNAWTRKWLGKHHSKYKQVKRILIRYEKEVENTQEKGGQAASDNSESR